MPVVLKVLRGGRSYEGRKTGEWMNMYKMEKAQNSQCHDHSGNQCAWNTGGTRTVPLSTRPPLSFQDGRPCYQTCL